MDIMAILGWLLSAVLITFGIIFNNDLIAEGLSPLVWSNFWSFIDYPSIAITIGGTIAVLMIAFPAKAWAKVPKHLKIIMFPTQYNPYSYIEQIVEFAKEARIKGLLSLEDKLNETEDLFLKKSLMLVVDSVEAEKVRDLLETDMDYLEDRHAQDRTFYERGAALAPAFGMIGTLIGLINMLKDMEDPNTIGPAMAVALVTTFYGTVFSNVFFIPVASKLKIRHNEEFLCRMLICEGVQAIQAGENPKFIEEKLTMLLPSSANDQGGGKSKGASDEEPKGKGKRFGRSKRK
jgi:chemotaxis protein MotA